MPIKIEPSDSGSAILINGVPYNKGNIEIEPNRDNSLISFFHVRTNKEIIGLEPLSEFVDNNDNPFATFEDFVTYLDSFFFRSVGGSPSGGVVVKSSTPPSDLNAIWFNTDDDIFYFNDNGDWLSEQLYEVLFNDQGTTPNNTWFRIGNTVGNDLGNGYNMAYESRIVGLSYNRLAGTAQAGNFWLYSNTSTGTNNAAVVTVFNVDTSARGFLNPNVETTILKNKYVSMRWNGNQTNNNVLSLYFRRKYS